MKSKEYVYKGVRKIEVGRDRDRDRGDGTGGSLHKRGDSF